MKRFNIINLGFVLFLNSYMAVSKESYEGMFQIGDEVLTNCHQIFTRGIIERKATEGFVVEFARKSRPIRCPPFRWHHEFLEPFVAVKEYRLITKASGFFDSDENILFKVGEAVTIQLEPDSRMMGVNGLVDIKAEITDIANNGSIAVKRLNEGPLIESAFVTWLGTNYIDLRHAALEFERDQRSK